MAKKRETMVPLIKADDSGWTTWFSLRPYDFDRTGGHDLWYMHDYECDFCKQRKHRRLMIHETMRSGKRRHFCDKACKAQWHARFRRKGR
jgi:hypothetical protein